jgi:hypothetical protein
LEVLGPPLVNGHFLAVPPDAEVALEKVSLEARVKVPMPRLESVDWSRTLFEDEGRTLFIQATGAETGVENMFIPWVYGVWCMVYGVWCMVYGVW